MHLIRTSTYQIMSGLFECIFNIKSKCITDNPGFICTLQSNFFLIQWVYIVLWKTNIKIWFALAKEGTFLTIFTILFPFLLEDLRIVFVLFFLYLIVSIKSISKNHDIWSLNQFVIAWILAIISKILKRLQTWKCFAD